MTRSIDRLEQLMVLWEDGNFLQLQDATARYKAKVKPDVPGAASVFFHGQFRDHLLSGDEYLDDGRFLHPMPDSTDRWLGMAFPYSIFAWNKCSRRVFCPSADLQRLMASTSLQGVNWNDIPFPFGSFAIALEVPIKDEHNDRSFDCILVSNLNDAMKKDAECISIYLISTKLKDYLKVSSRDKKLFKRYLRRGEWNQVIKLANKGKKKLPHPGFPFLVTREHMNSPIVESIGGMMATYAKRTAKHAETTWIDIEGMPPIPYANKKEMEKHEQEYAEHEFGHAQIAARIIAGLCLYLSSLPSESRHKERKRYEKNKGHAKNKRVITSGADLFLVTCEQVLTDKQRELIDDMMQGESGKGGYEVSTHFRRGHWRKAPGQANNPDAPKNVWVRPTLVRRDRLEKGSVPGATESDLV